MMRTNKSKNNLLTTEVLSNQILPDLPIVHVGKEFFPDWVKQKPGKYICPVCKRPHHKEPGPFTYGIAVNKNEKMFPLWVQSFGCCKTVQEFSFQSIKRQNINSENIVPILKKVFTF